MKKDNALIRYIKDSISELNKVTWPTKNQAIKLTFIVLGFILATAILLGIFDYVFNIGFRELIKLRPPTPISEQVIEVGGDEVTDELVIEEQPTEEDSGFEFDTSGLTITDSEGNVLTEEEIEESIKFEVFDPNEGPPPSLDEESTE